ncbi:hypothetical protein AVEN_53004-1, partial [Araneus ventricosus]
MQLNSVLWYCSFGKPNDFAAQPPTISSVHYGITSSKDRPVHLHFTEHPRLSFGLLCQGRQRLPSAKFLKSPRQDGVGEKSPKRNLCFL